MIKKNFIRLFEDSIRNNWELNAFTNYGEKVNYTYREVGMEVAHLHLLFEQCGIERNDKISLIGRNNANWGILYIATVTYGAIIVPILQDFNANDIHHIVNHSESKLLFASDYIWENLEEEKMPGLKVVFSLNTFEPILVHEQVAELDENERPIEIEKNNLCEEQISRKAIDQLFAAKYEHGFHKDSVRYADKPNTEIASINYTSGTTGFSKGVMTSGNALAGNVTFGFTTKLITREAKVVSFLPLAHSYGCAFDFLTGFCAGGHIHFIGKTPSPKILLKAFAEVKPQVIFCVPLIIEKIYKKQILPLLAKPTMQWVLKVPLLDQTVLSQIRKKLMDAFGGEFIEIVAGGAPLNAEVEEFFRKINFPFTIGYGMTECAPLITYSRHDDFAPFSVGKLLPTMEAMIDSPDPNTGMGEILVRGENLMDGYFKNQEATDQVMMEDGWMRTGDLGKIDAEKNIYIRGRNKTMILGASGQNIFPEEIEAKFNNMPYVLESLVVEQEGKLIALICPDYEAVDSEHLNHTQLQEKMEENRKAVNAMGAAYEAITKVKLFPHEFEKTPKKSIKRYLYTTN